MKKYLSHLCCLVGFIFLQGVVGHAQVIDKVDSKKIWVSGLSDKSLKVGDKINLLDEGLNQVGVATVEKISSGGTSLVAVLDGDKKATVGLRVEKATSQIHSGSDYSKLSEAERKILTQGEISTTRYVLGGVLGTYPLGLGLGIGHAIQGRYTDKGWIFTVGELASVAVLAAGIEDCAFSEYRDDDCDGSGLIFLGLFGYVGFRIWEIIDVWSAPPEHNQKYREIKSRVGAVQPIKWEGLALAPTREGLILGTKISF